MANKIKKALSDIEHEVEAMAQDVERVAVKFLGHVRHDGKDYRAGETAQIQTDAAAKLIAASAAEPVAGEPKGAPAPDGDPAAATQAADGAPAPIEDAK